MESKQFTALSRSSAVYNDTAIAQSESQPLSQPAARAITARAPAGTLDELAGKKQAFAAATPITQPAISSQTGRLNHLPSEVLRIIAHDIAAPKDGTSQLAANRHLWSFATSSKRIWRESSKELQAVQLYERAAQLGGDDDDAPLTSFATILDEALAFWPPRPKLAGYVIEQIRDLPKEQLAAVNLTLEKLRNQPNSECAMQYLALLKVMPRIINQVELPQAGTASAQYELFNAGVSIIGRLRGADRIQAVSILGTMLDRLPESEIAAGFDALLHAATSGRPVPVAELALCLHDLPHASRQRHIDSLLSIAEEHCVADAVGPLALAAFEAFGTSLANDALAAEVTLRARLERLQALTSHLSEQRVIPLDDLCDTLKTFAALLAYLPTEQNQHTLAWLMNQIDKVADRFESEEQADIHLITNLLISVTSQLNRLSPQQQENVFDWMTDHVYALSKPTYRSDTGHGRDIKSSMERRASSTELNIDTLAITLSSHLHCLAEPVQVRAFAWLVQHFDKVDNSTQLRILETLVAQANHLVPDVSKYVRDVANIL